MGGSTVGRVRFVHIRAGGLCVATRVAAWREARAEGPERDAFSSIARDAAITRIARERAWTCAGRFAIPDRIARRPATITPWVDGGPPVVFDIAMGARREDRALRGELDVAWGARGDRDRGRP